MTIEQAYKDFTARLKIIYEEREAMNIADWVFENVTGRKRFARLNNKEEIINNTTVDQLNNKLNELLQYRPVQYVLEEAWFYKMKLYVNQAVLIPRPETEELVEWVVDEIQMKNEKLKIIDIGTGSGCIAIALKKELPGSEIFAIDVSNDALNVAAKNAHNQSVEINLCKQDFLDEQTWNRLPVFDVAVSNPPYIPASEKCTLSKNVADFEPAEALFVKDDDPFIFYEKIAVFCKKQLKEKGKIFAEINDGSADGVKEIFTQHQYTSVVRKDMYGKERMICAWK